MRLRHALPIASAAQSRTLPLLQDPADRVYDPLAHRAPRNSRFRTLRRGALSLTGGKRFCLLNPRKCFVRIKSCQAEPFGSADFRRSRALPDKPVENHQPALVGRNVFGHLKTALDQRQALREV